jgi:RNA-directed DNA polymerase
LDFLGYSFRYDESLYGRGPKYLNRFPSKKSLSKAREEIRELTATRLGGLPIGQVVRRLNQYLVGWSNYFARGYPRKAFRDINAYVLLRMWRHLRRRSQRSLKPPEGMNWYTFTYERLGVIQL